MLLPQREGNFNLEPIVLFLMFYPSLSKLQFPGPGLLVWLKMDTDLQSYLPWPMESPCLGLLLNSDGRVYLSGEGELFLLNGLKVTLRCPLCCRTRRRGLFSSICSIFHRSSNCMRQGLRGVDGDFRKSLAFGEAEHGFGFGGIQRRAIDLAEALLYCWIFLHSSKIYYIEASSEQQEINIFTLIGIEFRRRYQKCWYSGPNTTKFRVPSNLALIINAKHYRTIKSKVQQAKYVGAFGNAVFLQFRTMFNNIRASFMKNGLSGVFFFCN